jgi:hypothetical protein
MDIPAIVESLFGRKMTEGAAREMAKEIRDRCKETSQAEVRNALRALADRTADQANRTLPTAPEVSREIWSARKKPKDTNNETTEEAMLAIAGESDPDVRWAMIVHRGCPQSLLDAVSLNGIEVRRYTHGNPLFAWAVALSQDPDYQARAAKLFADSEDRAMPAESGREKARRRDAYSRRLHDLFLATIDRRSAEGWTPPPVARTVNPIAAAILECLKKNPAQAVNQGAER